ncbi:MAG: hypothetical protein V4524_02830 [Patescibacteria group bacterium]
MALDTYKQEQERLAKEEEIKLHGEPEEEKEELTLKTIMANKEQSALFAKMIKDSGDATAAEITGRFMNGAPGEDDLDAMEEYRAQFEKRMNQVESVNGELSAEFIADLGEQSPDFKKILKALGSEASSEMIKDKMADLAVSDPDRFDTIVKKVEKLQEFKKGTYKDVEDAVKKMAEENNIDADAYMKALAIADEGEREKALQDLVRNQWGFAHKTADSLFSFFGGGSAKIAEKLADEKGTVDEVHAALDKHKKGIGKVLAASVTGNEDMRNALAKSVLGEPVKKERVNMKESRDLLPKETDIDKQWIPFRDAFAVGGKKWDALTDAEKDAGRAVFGDKMKAESKKKAKDKGFWASLFDSLFGSLVDSKLSKLN